MVYNLIYHDGQSEGCRYVIKLLHFGVCEAGTEKLWISKLSYILNPVSTGPFLVTLY